MLGEEGDAAKYAELAGSIRQAFQDEYVSPRGRIVSDTQTAYALALEFGLLPDPTSGPGPGSAWWSSCARRVITSRPASSAPR